MSEVASTQAPIQTAALAATAAPGSPQRARGDTLAYEHNISVEMDKELLPTISGKRSAW
jgi:hypothetical protein